MENKLKKTLRRLAYFQVENPYLSLIFIIILSIMIWGGISKVQTVSSLEQMMPNDIEEIGAFNTLRDNNLGQGMLALVVKIDRNSSIRNSVSDIKDFKVYEYSKELILNLESEPDILGSYSFAKVINLNSNQTNVSQIEYLNLIKNSQILSQISGFVNKDSSISVIILRTDVSADDFRMNLLASKIKKTVEDIGKPAGVEVKLTGSPIIQQRLGELINIDRQNTMWISTFLVFLITALIFRSISSAIVPILVVFISVNWLYGTMGYTSLPISTLAGGVAAMVIGIGIDFAIHIMNKFKFERKNGLSIKDSIELSVVQTGTALIATSATTIFAFLTFMIGVMPEMGRFGILMAIGIFYSLVFSLFGLPALLVLEERFIYYLKKKLKFGIDNELVLVKNQLSQKNKISKENETIGGINI